VPTQNFGVSAEFLTNLLLVEPFFRGRKTYDSKATHNELGPDFFPEGSQRVYVLSPSPSDAALLNEFLPGPPIQDPRPGRQDYAPPRLARYYGRVSQVWQTGPSVSLSEC
jgi:hypothetical protein